MNAYDDAVAELYQAPHGSFVAERKRLATELKAAGDKAGAARFAKHGRPTISAWAVNQLWWQARDAFEALFETAAKLRNGGLAASGPHREAIAKLRARASRILGDAGHAATEGTLRKVTQTLAALAATGSWDPDRAGAISADRAPPGFEAIGIADDTQPTKEPSRDELADLRKRKAAAEVAEREEAAAERRRIEVERARSQAERHRIEAALRTTRGQVAAQERDVEKLRKQLADAEDNLAQAQAVAEDLLDKLDSLE